MDSSRINPIRSVDDNPISTILAEDGYDYSLHSVASSNSGRREDLTMDNDQLGYCVKLRLKWVDVPVAEASTIFKAFKKPYVTVNCLDGEDGEFRETEFYVGSERAAGKFSPVTGTWETITVSLTERGARR